MKLSESTWIKYKSNGIRNWSCIWWFTKLQLSCFQTNTLEFPHFHELHYRNLRNPLRNSIQNIYRFKNAINTSIGKNVRGMNTFQETPSFLSDHNLKGYIPTLLISREILFNKQNVERVPIILRRKMKKIVQHLWSEVKLTLFPFC